MQKRRSNARRTADVRVILDVLMFAKTRVGAARSGGNLSKRIA
jgi:hypothetical protein